MSVPVTFKSEDAAINRSAEQTKKQSAIPLGLPTSSSISSAKSDECKAPGTEVVAAKKVTPIKPIQVTSVEFARRGFFDCTVVATDEMNAHESSITSVGMGDCITIFGISKQNGKVREVFANHIDAASEESDIYHELEDFFDVDDDDQFDLYIIGGNENSVKAGLPKFIKDAAAHFFGDKARIVFCLLDPPKTKDEPYVAANLQSTGELTYCHHQEV